LRGIDPPVVGTYDKNPKIPEFNYIPDYRRNKHRELPTLGWELGQILKLMKRTRTRKYLSSAPAARTMPWLSKASNALELKGEE
jgi:hypothetical protein